jgi:hypothetical protein
MAFSIPMFAAVTAAICTTAVLSSQGLAGDALQKALHDKAADFWIYDDLDQGYKTARQTGKPLLVSFRCVP